MNQKPIIVVLGATGAQGGGVIRHLLKSEKYLLRALTRDPSSAVAKELTNQGVEVLKADVGNRVDLEKAFTGAYGVFAVTNYFDPQVWQNPELEQIQGRLIADVAAEKGVQHYIWSSLHDVEKITGGKLNVPHFTGKHKVEEYVRDLASKGKFKYTSYVYAGFYNTNFVKLASFMPTDKDKDGTILFQLPVKESTQLPFYDTEDLGGIVSELFKNPSEYNNRKILVGSEYLTLGQVAETYSKVTGRKARFEPIQYDSTKYSDDFLVWWSDYGFFNKEDISEARKI